MLKNIDEQFEDQQWKEEVCGNCGFFLKERCRRTFDLVSESNKACPSFVSKQASFHCTVCGETVTNGLCVETLFEDLIKNRGWIVSDNLLFCPECRKENLV